MIMKTTKEKIEVMQAYDRGEQIEACYNGVWVNIDMPEWSWGLRDYRVKPNKKYVTFDTAEEFLAAQRKHGETVRYKLDDELYHSYINNRAETILVSHYGRTCSIMTNIVNMYDKYEFEDGTPCGKEVKSCQH